MLHYFDILCTRFHKRLSFKGKILLYYHKRTKSYTCFFHLSHSSSGFHGSLMPKNSQFVPPALPPKKHKITSSNASLNSITTPPTSPKMSNDDVFTNNSKNMENFEENSFSGNIQNQSDRIHHVKNEDDSENETVVLRKKTSEMVHSNLSLT